MDAARALGALSLSLLEPLELPSHSPYCLAGPWRLDLPSFGAGICLGLILLPLAEICLALRWLALRSLADQRGPEGRRLYRLL